MGPALRRRRSRRGGPGAALPPLGDVCVCVFRRGLGPAWSCGGAGGGGQVVVAAGPHLRPQEPAALVSPRGLAGTCLPSRSLTYRGEAAGTFNALLNFV